MTAKTKTHRIRILTAKPNGGFDTYDTFATAERNAHIVIDEWTDTTSRRVAMIRVGPETYPEDKSDTATSIKEQARQIERAEYYASIENLASTVLMRVNEEGADLHDALHETVDGSYWVIYTHAHFQALRASDNWTAVDDAGGTSGDDFAKSMQLATFYTVEADVRDAVEHMTLDRDEEE